MIAAESGAGGPAAAGAAAHAPEIENLTHLNNPKAAAITALRTRIISRFTELEEELGFSAYPYVSGIDRDHEKWSASAAWAAFWPHMPCTPPPGGVELEHRYTPGIAVRYGFHRGVGRSTVCSRVPAPPLMSPPT